MDQALRQLLLSILCLDKQVLLWQCKLGAFMIQLNTIYFRENKDHIDYATPVAFAGNYSL